MTLWLGVAWFVAGYSIGVALELYRSGRIIAGLRAEIAALERRLGPPR